MPKQVEFVVSLDNLLSIQVEAEIDETGEVDWDAVERLARSQFKQVLQQFIERTPDADLQMYVTDTNEKRDI